MTEKIGKFLTAYVQCNVCLHRWVAIVEPGWKPETRLECSSCGGMTGEITEENGP